MGDFQIKVRPKVYDIVIIGSGAGGGMAAYTLANPGLKIDLFGVAFLCYLILIYQPKMLSSWQNVFYR